jgi:hypothetical protein
MSVPTALRFTDDCVNVDGVGYFPDVWVHPDCALERTLKFVRRYLVEHTDEQVGEHDPLRASELCSLEAPI